MDGAIARIFTESSLTSVMLLVALIWVTRQWLKEREERLNLLVDQLKTQIEREEKYVRLTEQLKSTVENHTRVIEAMNPR